MIHSFIATEPSTKLVYIYTERTGPLLAPTPPYLLILLKNIDPLFIRRSSRNQDNCAYFPN